MNTKQSPTAARKATNLSIDTELLRQARELNINLSRTLEERLAELIREKRRQQWLEENRSAIQDYNRHVSERAVFSDKLRRF